MNAVYEMSKRAALMLNPAEATRKLHGSVDIRPKAQLAKPAKPRAMSVIGATNAGKRTMPLSTTQSLPSQT